MDSSVSPTHGEQEMSIWNGHYQCTCYHPLFVFNQFGEERCVLRPGNVHSADGWEGVLKPVMRSRATHGRSASRCQQEWPDQPFGRRAECQDCGQSSAPLGLARTRKKRKNSCPFGIHLGNPGYKSVGRYETR
jgi:hypothetical protein